MQKGLDEVIIELTNKTENLMANIYWDEEKVSPSKIQDHIMFEAEKELAGKTNFGFRIDEGAAELWIECGHPNDDSTTYWHILNSQAKIMGWRVLIFKCPVGYLECFETHKNIRALRLVDTQDNHPLT